MKRHTSLTLSMLLLAACSSSTPLFGTESSDTRSSGGTSNEYMQTPMGKGESTTGRVHDVTQQISNATPGVISAVLRESGATTDEAFAQRVAESLQKLLEPVATESIERLAQQPEVGLNVFGKYFQAYEMLREQKFGGGFLRTGKSINAPDLIAVGAKLALVYIAKAQNGQAAADAAENFIRQGGRPYNRAQVLATALEAHLDAANAQGAEALAAEGPQQLDYLAHYLAAYESEKLPTKFIRNLFASDTITKKNYPGLGAKLAQARTLLAGQQEEAEERERQRKQAESEQATREAQKRSETEARKRLEATHREEERLKQQAALQDQQRALDEAQERARRQTAQQEAERKAAAAREETAAKAARDKEQQRLLAQEVLRKRQQERAAAVERRKQEEERRSQQEELRRREEERSQQAEQRSDQQATLTPPALDTGRTTVTAEPQPLTGDAARIAARFEEFTDRLAALYYRAYLLGGILDPREVAQYEAQQRGGAERLHMD